MEKDFALNRVSGCLFGMTVGDALGMPGNGLSKYDVSRKYQVLDNFYIKGGPYSWVARSSLLIASALIKADGVNPELILSQLAAVKAEEPLMDETFEAISLKKPSMARSPRLASRVIPMALYSALKGFDDKELVKLCKIACEVSHTHKQAVLASFMIAKVISECIRNRRGLEHQFDLFQGEKSLMARLIIICRQAEENMAVESDRLSERLLLTRRMLQKHVTPDEFLGYNGNFRSIDECVCFSLFSFLRGPDSYQSLTNTVSSGGESSLNGALTGAMIGAYTGPGFINIEIREGVKNHVDLTLLAENLTERFFKEGV